MSMAKYFSTQHVWSYQYNVHDRKDDAAGLGVPHTVETPAIWGPPNGFCDECQYSKHHEDAPIVPVVMDLWISFVKALDPNPYRDAKTPYWQSWGTTGSSGRRLKIQLKDTTMEGLPAEQIEKCKFWRSLASVTEQ